MWTFLDCFIDATTFQLIRPRSAREKARILINLLYIYMLISIYCGIYCGTRIKGKVPQIVGLTLT